MINNKVPNYTKILTLSLAIDYGDLMEEFVELFQANEHWLVKLDVLYKNITYWRSMQIVNFEYFEDLCSALCTPSIKDVLHQNSKHYVTVRLEDWL